MRTQKIIEYELGAKKHRGERGRDKQTRKINVNSLRNLKPFQQITDMNDLNQFTQVQPQKSSSNSNLWIAVFIIFGLVIGYFIWKYYKKKAEQSDESDSLANITGGTQSNG